MDKGVEKGIIYFFWGASAPYKMDLSAVIAGYNGKNLLLWILMKGHLKLMKNTLENTLEDV